VGKEPSKAVIILSEKCNLLILTARFGGGHISVANAVKDRLICADSDYMVSMFDICDVLIPERADLLYRCYDAMVRKAPYIYNYSMYHGLAEKIYMRVKLSSEGDRCFENFDRLIREMEPDAILSVFPVCTDAASIYKGATNSDIPLFTCITDVVDTDEWIHPNNDIYFVSHESMAESLARKGVPPEKMMVTGIPVRKEFFGNGDRVGLREKLGFGEEDFVIIIMGGGLGRVPDSALFYMWLNRRRNVKTVVITTRNSTLNRKLRMLKLRNCRIFEYLEDISDYMGCADLIVSKGGGVTLFESIASGLPMVVYKPELNQELENSRFITSQGIGVVAKSIGDLKRTIRDMMSGEVRESIVERIRPLREAVRTDIMVETIMNTKKDRR
jgi:processive 1,2-diacylglycerol beta-glucosyltransferase